MNRRKLALAGIFIGCWCQFAAAENAVRYTISLADPEHHLVHVRMAIPPGSDTRELQLPVWNALYQVRDFSQYMNWIHAKDASGRALPLIQLNASRWTISGSAKGAIVGYEMFSNDSGSFGAELNAQHAFFNLAEILLYEDDKRNDPVQVEFQQIPNSWKVATPLTQNGEFYQARNYDQLVDSPVEIGAFIESDFHAECGDYRVILDSPDAQSVMNKILPLLQRIASEASRWMDDCPFHSYMFIFHFSDSPGRGGMEHAYSTAITLPAKSLSGDMETFTGVSAHEFFHLWNVKRIRPQSLEPIDYTEESYTPALWFSEGVDSTASDCIRLRAGLLDEHRYLDLLGEGITELEDRPAHLTQSVERSSEDAWLEKYPYYGLPARSISYYNKGELLGVLLDVRMREASHDQASLQTLFRWMNEHFAKQGKFFNDSDAIRQAAAKISGADLEKFFSDYVSGVSEIPWDKFFAYVGLRVKSSDAVSVHRGFEAVQKFDRPPVVVEVDPGSEAEHAGLRTDDLILQVDGQPAGRDFDKAIDAIGSGAVLRLSISRGGSERDLQWTLGSIKRKVFQLEDIPEITADQKKHRALWLFDGAPPLQ
jgi:predicted metalloprotease with PDZ domain